METLLNGGRNLRMSPEEYAKKLWDWTSLNGCFERGIRLTDVDGMVEANNKFLFLEGKSKDIDLPKGQKWALERLAKIPEITVVSFNGEPPDLNTITFWEILGKKKYEGNFKEFYEFVHKWFLWAEGRLNAR